MMCLENPFTVWQTQWTLTLLQTATEPIVPYSDCRASHLVAPHDNTSLPLSFMQITICVVPLIPSYIARLYSRRP